MQLADTDFDLNEDARVQLRNIQRQSTIVGLVKRRDDLVSNRPTMREKHIVVDEAKFNDGLFTNEFAKKVEQSLSFDDSKNLTEIADKIMDQQFAAVNKTQPLRVSFPSRGKMIHFKGDLQITPEADINIQFYAGKIYASILPLEEWRNTAVLFILIILLLRITLGKAGKNHTR